MFLYFLEWIRSFDLWIIDSIPNKSHEFTGFEDGIEIVSNWRYHTWQESLTILIKYGHDIWQITIFRSVNNFLSGMLEVTTNIKDT